MKKKRCFMAIAVSLVMTISFGSLSAFAAVHNIKDAKWYRQTASNWCWAAVSETMIDKETLILRQMGLPIDKRESFMQRTIIPIILLGHQQI